MPSFRHNIDIDATPDQVSAVLGDISLADRWIPGVTSVTVDGMTRVCVFEDGHTQDEQIVDYSPQYRTYRYLIDGAPLPVTDNTGTPSKKRAVDHGLCGNRASSRLTRRWERNWPRCGSPTFP